MTKTLAPLFELGQIVITPACLSEILSGSEMPSLRLRLNGPRTYGWA